MAEQRPPNRMILGLLAAGAVLAALFLFWPSSPDPTPVAAPAPAPVVATVFPSEPMAPPPVPVKREVPTQEEWEDERDVDIPATKNCYDIMALKWQGTHDFITLDLIRDRGTLYQMDDLACLSAEGANPAILDHVERYQDRRQFLDQ